MPSRASLRGVFLTIFIAVSSAPGLVQAAAATRDASAVADVLTPAQSRAVDRAVDRALAWIAANQQPDGSFPTLEMGQPAVTAICVLAMLSRGHLPGKGPYGTQMEQAIGYVLASRHDGIISRVRPAFTNDMLQIQTVAYNHAIGGLLLAEVYGQAPDRLNEQIRPALEAALKVALERYPQPKRHREDQGGWRYYRYHQDSDSDLSVTSWSLMFLRSCRNAGFEVPTPPVEDALQFVSRCYDPRQRIFWYALRGREHVTTRAMTGAGILSLSLAGRHQTAEAKAAGDWILEHPFDRNMSRSGTHDRYFYGAFYCSQAMFQLGGRHWREFYPSLASSLLALQRSNGSWDQEQGYDRVFGNVYTSAMAVLALSPPYQLLPIFQR